MTDEQYNEIPALRRSALWQLRKSPAHYKYAVEHPQEETPALRFGIAAHMSILEPERYMDEYIIAPKIDRRTKAGKEQYAALMESGRIVLPNDEGDAIKAMTEAVLSNKEAAELIKGEHEVPIEWTDTKTGERCKCRPDVIGNDVIVDYKTTASCEDYAFERSAKKHGYQLQAAMYREGLLQTRFKEYGFVFIAQEKNPPYAVRIYKCDKGWIDDGVTIYRDLLDLFHYCRINNRWDGYEEVTMYGE
jgi:hypothetical protein